MSPGSNSLEGLNMKRVILLFQMYIMAATPLFTQTIQGRPSDVLRDNLCMTDLQVYDGFYLSYCGGSVFGQAYNFQCGDGFATTEAYWITSVNIDFLTAYGQTPDHLCVNFFEVQGGGCDSSETEFCGRNILPGAFQWDPFQDTVYGKEGRRATIPLEEPCRLPQGCWLVSVQYASEADAAGAVAISYGRGLEFECLGGGRVYTRDGREHDPCCQLEGEPNLWTDWRNDGTFEPDSLCTRVEGIPAGDCAGGEEVRAKCKPGGGERLGKVIVKVTDGEPHGAVTALFDPPDPQHVSIALDATGRGKGKFKRVPLGDHRVFVCDAIVSVGCNP